MSTVNLGRVQGSSIWGWRPYSRGTSGFKGFPSYRPEDTIRPLTGDLIIAEQAYDDETFHVAVGDIFMVGTVDAQGGYEIESSSMLPLTSVKGTTGEDGVDGVDGTSIWAANYSNLMGDTIYLSFPYLDDVSKSVKVGDFALVGYGNGTYDGNIYRIKTVSQSSATTDASTVYGNLKGKSGVGWYYCRLPHQAYEPSVEDISPTGFTIGDYIMNEEGWLDRITGINTSTNVVLTEEVLGASGQPINYMGPQGPQGQQPPLTQTITYDSDTAPSNLAVYDALANKADYATTLAGYGITNAVTTNTAQTISGAKTFSTVPSIPTSSATAGHSDIANTDWVTKWFDSDHISTAKGSSRFSRSGYMKFPNGLIINWGYISGPLGTSGKIATFATSFSTIPIITLSTDAPNDTSTTVIQPKVIALTSTYVRAINVFRGGGSEGGHAGEGVFYIAVGYSS